MIKNPSSLYRESLGALIDSIPAGKAMDLTRYVDETGNLYLVVVARGEEVQRLADLFERASKGTATPEDHVTLLEAVFQAAQDYDTWRYDPGTTEGYLKELLGKLSDAIEAVEEYRRKRDQAVPDPEVDPCALGDGPASL